MAKKTELQGVDAKIAELEKKYGLSRSNINPPKVVTSGSIQLDRATGIGGIPVGKLIELMGNESCGKSTIALHAIKEFQKAFPTKKVLLQDTEHSFSPTYAKSIGVDIDNLLIYQPDHMEQAYDLILSFIENDIVSLVCLDSMTASLPKAVIDGDIGDATIGLAARINSKFCGKVKGLLDIHNCTMISISQMRANIGGMTPGDVSTGGNAWKFYADMRWKVWKLNDKENELNKTTVDIIKNKLSNPFGQAKIAILWGKGFDTTGEIINYAIEFDIIKKGGAWFSFRDEKFQGMENLKVFLEDNPEILEYITKEVMSRLDNTEVKIEENESED